MTNSTKTMFRNELKSTLYKLLIYYNNAYIFKICMIYRMFFQYIILTIFIFGLYKNIGFSKSYEIRREKLEKILKVKI